MPMASSLRRAVAFVALANLAYFAVEFAVALSIGSVSLFADSTDFLEDTFVNLLIFFALAWSALTRARVGMLLAGVLLAPAIATLWTILAKLAAPAPPEPITLSLTGTGALAINLLCAFVLARHRTGSGSLTKAAYLSARNDALANLGIIAAGLVTLAWVSVWPDIVVGCAIGVMNVDAARSVWRAARDEGKQAQA